MTSTSRKLLIVTLIAMLGALPALWIIKKRGTADYGDCHFVLNRIDCQKQSWAVLKGKTSNDTPAWSELIGPDSLFQKKPRCPQGGAYTLGKLSEPPLCSHPGHTLAAGNENPK